MREEEIYSVYLLYLRQHALMPKQRMNESAIPNLYNKEILLSVKRECFLYSIYAIRAYTTIGLVEQVVDGDLNQYEF